MVDVLSLLNFLVKPSLLTPIRLSCVTFVYFELDYQVYPSLVAILGYPLLFMCHAASLLSAALFVIWLEKISPNTPSLNDKIDSGNTHLQDLARWWRTSKGVDIPKISQFYWALFEIMRFLCFSL